MALAATATMAVSFSLLFVMATVGPLLVADMGLSRASLGGVVAAAYAVAAVVWRPAAGVVDRLGARHTMAITAALAATALVLVATARGLPNLVVASVVAGLGQALANPATNLEIASSFGESSARATAVGTKQAGVPLGALVAGAAVPSAAGAWGWRAAVASAALVAMAVVVLPLRTYSSAPPSRPRAGAVAISRDASLLLLCAFQLLLGAGVATVNTYLPLFATETLAVEPRVAGTLTLMIGVTGIAARVVVTRLSAGAGRAQGALGRLTALSVAGALALSAAPLGGAWLAWLGAFLVGGTAVAANAVAMLVVIERHRPPATARASGIVSAGFFGGFAVGPPLFGFVVDGTGSYPTGWALVAGVLAAATVTAATAQRLRSGRARFGSTPPSVRQPSTRVGT